MAATRFDTPIQNIWKREIEFTTLLMKMESRGVRIDQDMCKAEMDYGNGRMYWLHKELGNLSPTSPKDIALLFMSISLPLSEEHKTSKGNYSFDKTAMAYYDELLELRADGFGDSAKKILEYRGWSKTVSSNYKPYLELVSPDGRLRCNFNQIGTKTTRLSCNSPNLQQIPRSSDKRWNGNLKKAFVAKPGFVLVANDYSQLEFRLAAAYARQENLIEIFNRSEHPEKFTKQERDIFIQMCLEMHLSPEEARQAMKTLTYAKAFGAGMLKIAVMLGESIPEWVNKYFNQWTDYPEQAQAAKEYVANTEAGKFYLAWEKKYQRMTDNSVYVNSVAKSRGYINLWTGRRRHFQYKWESRKAYNSLIQGGGAEIVKSAMLRLFKEVDNPDCEMLLQVHDSVVFEIRESKVDFYLPIIQEVMARTSAEKDFGVYFATEPEYWGK